MSTYSLSHLTDQVLLRDLAALVARDRATTAALLAHLAEVDARRLYLPAAYPSMYAYCTHELRLSEDAAYKRIQAARTARQFPAIFEAVADGRLHLSAVVLLAPYLTLDHANELLAAAAHKTKCEIERLLAERFPRSEMLTLVQASPAAPALRSEQPPVGEGAEASPARASGLAGQLAPGQVETLVERPSVRPLAAQRFALQLAIGQDTCDLLGYAQALLSHQIPSGDVVQVLHRALEALVRELEKTKFSATSKPRPSRRCSAGITRYIPADVKRAFWKRDGGQCSFVSDAGQRCAARKFLEFDHVEPVARGGQATVAGIRLRCRAHNQFAAECAFGPEFMRCKREEAQRAAEERGVAAQARARANAAVEEIKQDLICALRNLGFRADEVHRVAAQCETIPDASLEERLRVALRYLCPKGHRRSAPISAASHMQKAAVPGVMHHSGI